MQVQMMMVPQNMSFNSSYQYSTNDYVTLFNTLLYFINLETNSPAE